MSETGKVDIALKAAVISGDYDQSPYVRSLLKEVSDEIVRLRALVEQQKRALDLNANEQEMYDGAANVAKSLCGAEHEQHRNIGAIITGLMAVVTGIQLRARTAYEAARAGGEKK